MPDPKQKVLDAVTSAVAEWPRARRWLVGFSGGGDSTALLRALVAVAPEAVHVEAIHFDHGLNAASADWAEHCRRTCRSLGVPLEVVTLTIRPEPRDSLEAVAREARLAEAEQRLGSDDVLVLGHHLDDQAETVLLNLLRGSGVEGLAAMPPIRQLGRGWLARPLLQVDRDVLQAWLAAEHNEWIDDPANEQPEHDRNWLRHELIPVLEGRFPSASQSLARSARHCATAVTALDQWLEDRAPSDSLDDIVLTGAILKDLDTPVKALAVRRWLARHDVPMPPAHRLFELLRQMSVVGPDRSPEMRWQSHALRMHAGDLWLGPAEVPRIGPSLDEPLPATIRLPAGCGDWQASTPGPEGHELRLTAIRSGDSIRPGRGRPRQPVRRWLAEAGVPAWLRDAVPVVRRRDELVMVGDAGPFGTTLLEAAWRPQDPSLHRVAERLRTAARQAG